MFRTLVSNLPYSPTLVGQLGFYARRLRKEEVTRRTGLLFTALALVMQSFAVFSPPEPANAANPSDMIYGGISSKEQLLVAYDNSARGNGDLKKIYDYAGITREELAGLKEGTINSRQHGTANGAWLTWGRLHRFSAAEGEVSHNANGTTVYSRPLWRFDTSSYAKKNGTTYYALIGHSAKLGSFAIQKACGNLVTTKLPVTPPPTPPPAPVAESRCVLLQAKRIDRTRYTLDITATATNGASISGYKFVVKDASGAVIAEKHSNTTASSGSSGVIEIATPGTYSVVGSVVTSIGERSSNSCIANFSVSAPEKCAYNPSLSKEDKDCQPCPGNSTLWYKDADCTEQVASDKKATNLTQGKTNATTVTANASDRIEYKVSMYNTGKVPATVSFKEELSDVMEYATLHDNGGGTYDTKTHVLSWNDITLQPGESQSRTFVVSVLASIPTTARGTSDSTSYDCVMSNAFGNTVNIPVACEAPKLVEGIVAELPQTGMGANLTFAGIIAAVVTYFYARSRQLKKEVHLIRHEFNAGTL